ncbi:zinc finger protein [Theobroma cacao]|nr:zinc finger protein [Theobroma cacao]
MSSLSERSVMHIFGVTGMVIMTLMPMIATETSSPSSPLSSSSPASDLLFHPVERKKQQGSGDKEISYLQQDHRQKVIIQDQEDYGVWNPTPRSGGGGPIRDPNLQTEASTLPPSEKRISRGSHGHHICIKAPSTTGCKECLMLQRKDFEREKDLFLCAKVGLGQVFECRAWNYAFLFEGLNMSSRSRSSSRSRGLSRSRSRSPRDRRIRSHRFSHRDASFRRESRHGFRHIASECTTQAQCWNCREPGHVASHCPNEGICHSCGKTGHRARDCPNPQMQSGDMRLCNNCFRPGHLAADCTNDKACKNCRKTGHLARDCHSDPVCNLCNISGHVARQCPKGHILSDRGGGSRNNGYRDVVCRNCNQVGHISRECRGAPIICHNCGGRGHMAYECPSGRLADRGYRRY